MKLCRVPIAGVLISVGISAVSFADDGTTATTNIIRKCIPSENLRLKIDGKIGGFIAKKLTGIEGKGSGEIFRDGELLGKMIEASPNDAAQIYGMYLNCVKPEIDEYIEARTTSGPLEITPGTSFSAKNQSSVSLFGGDYVFSVREARLGRDRKTVWKVKTTLVGGGRTLYSQLEIGEGASLKGRPCSVVLTGIDNATYTYRFVLQCRR